MENKKFKNYYLLSILGVILASCYPIYMGITVIVDMIRYGTVYAENSPKYIIPYTPIALALLVGVALIPVAIKYFKKYAVLFGTVISTVIFFVSEFLFERNITVTRTITGAFAQLKDWQLALCAVTPEVFESGKLTEVDILMGEYSPAFKLHFYIISIVLIISILNCFYGFAKMIHTGDKSRCKSLTIQSIASGAFLGMCIWACFTAFYRNGDIKVSALSAILMSAFFVLFGVTVGIYVASFTLNKKPLLSVWLPSISATIVTLVMYIGEMILLSGHLYRFGDGVFFAGIPGIVLAPVDIVVMIASGVVAAIIANAVRNKNT